MDQRRVMPLVVALSVGVSTFCYGSTGIYTTGYGTQTEGMGGVSVATAEGDSGSTTGVSVGADGRPSPRPLARPLRGPPRSPDPGLDIRASSGVAVDDQQARATEFCGNLKSWVWS